MGNTKSALHITGHTRRASHIAGNAAARKRTYRPSISESVKSPPTVIATPKPKPWEMSERDIAFLSSQSGKYFKNN
jgi:hypothetical protein